MMARRCRRITLLALSLSAWFSAPAIGDGKFFARPLVEDPTVQMQRGLIAWRDGVETLIVQSSVAGGGDEMGWVIPLPAPPTAIEACPPHTLERLAELVAPRVQTSSSMALTAALLILVVSILILIGVLRKPNEPRIHRIARLLALYAVAFLLIPTLMFSLSTIRGPGAGVDILNAVSAGVYDVEIIRGDTAGAIEHWLSTNGFVQPAEARPVLADYVAKQWCFAVAKVRRAVPGAIEHHPLRFTFPAAQPVYPMTLTGVNQRTLSLDLFVIGDANANVPGMRTWVAQHMHPTSPESNWWMKFATSDVPIFRATTVPVRIGLPLVADLMWKGCVLTRLRGEFGRRELSEDLQVEWKSSKNFSARLHTAGSAWQLAAAAGLILCAGGLMLTATRVRTADAGGAWPARRMLLSTVVLAALAVGAVRAAITTVQVAPGRSWRDRYVTERILDRVLRKFTQVPPSTSFPDAYPAAIDAEIAQLEAPSDKLNQRLRDYTIEPDGEGWRLTLLDRDYIPVTIAIDSNGQPVPLTKKAPTPKTEEIPTGGN